jgi:regulator of protease activity HflC (stomatin/prohibitin superfamily)
MTDAPGQNMDGPGTEGDAPEPPRRGASAQFTVAESAGQEAARRQAMDPANQSLAEALRLSYRVLQVAILVLVVVFFFSGFQSVGEGQTGVKTRFGRIVGEPGQEQVSPGFQPFWPYPVGEILLVDQKRSVDLRTEFWPRLGRGQSTLAEATNAADSTQPLRPGTEEGSLVMGDGDLAHAQVSAEYVIEDSVRLLGELDPAMADALVRRVLMQATVQTAAQYSLQEFLESRDQPAQVLRGIAQEALDGLKCGIRLTSVTIPEKIAPLAVRNAFQRVQEAREGAKTAVAQAQQEANRTLVGVAGPQYGALLALIEEYETQLTRGDLPAADAAMNAIGAALEGREMSGETARIISRARAYQGALAASLSKDARRLQGLSPTFRENPRQLVRQLWLDGLKQVLDSSMVEVFAARLDGNPFRLAITSSPDVMQTRRQAEVEAKKRRAAMSGEFENPFQIGVREIVVDGPGRRLNKSGEKGFGRD